MATEIENGAYLNDLKVGDRVWVYSDRYGKKSSSAAIRTVLSPTRTLIRLANDIGNPQNYRLQHWEHDKSFHAYPSPYLGWPHDEQIMAVATPEECEEWDAAKVRESEKLDRNYRARVAADAVMKELQTLLYPGELRNVDCIQITNAQWGTREENSGLFDVQFHGLTEQQVRELAAKLEWPARGPERIGRTMANDMEIYDYCPECHRAVGIEDHNDDPEIERGMVHCTLCQWEGYDTWLVREDGTNEDETEDETEETDEHR